MESFFATAPRGLESLLVEELGPIGALQARQVPGGVAFSGDWPVCYAANLHSRLASRILWRVADFEYRDEHDLYSVVRAVDWARFFSAEQTIRVAVAAQKSPLKSLDFATLRVKDAVCDRFRDDTGGRPSVERAAPDVRIHVFLEEKTGALYLDTSGEPLFKRGWRKAMSEAPLRENLAAGILLLSGWKPDEVLLDPMCGGGTLLVEAAAIGLGAAPGAGRSFGFEKLKSFDEKLWNRIRNELRPRRRPLRLYGSDSDPRAIEAAKKNLASAGFGGLVKLERADILARGAPAAEGVMVANPPYGERIGSEEALAAFYPKLGDALKKNFAGWRCHFFTADRRMEKLIRLAPARRVPLFNGALECRLFEFRIVAGSHRR